MLIKILIFFFSDSIDTQTRFFWLGKRELCGDISKVQFLLLGGLHVRRTIYTEYEIYENALQFLPSFSGNISTGNTKLEKT